MTNFEILSLIFSGVTSIALVLAVIQIRINRQQLYLATISKCVQDFRSIEGLAKETTDKLILWKYIDLVSEELFYFQHDYVPKNVSFEWIDGMLDYMPVTNKVGQVLNEGNCLEYLAKNGEEYLSDFPRIRNAFTVTGIYEFSLIYAKERSLHHRRWKSRTKLIAEIFRNIKRGES